MNGRDRSSDTPAQFEQRIDELAAALQTAEQRLADRDKLLSSAIEQTESARAQYAQAAERAESLRRRLEAKEQQAHSLQTLLEAANTELVASRETNTSRDQRIATLERELRRRDDRIVALEQLCAENDNALNAINQEIKRNVSTSPADRLAEMGLALESLLEPGVLHRISRSTTTLGRSSANDIAINSNSISRYHARIVVEAEGVYLIDLQSTNGCRVNGQSISRQLLTDGDAIAIGDAQFRFTIGAMSAEAEDRSFDETFPLLDDSEFMTPAPKSTSEPARVHADRPGANKR
jgi:pSer/pThr/pTyr-binding forkhead associated (FHA) protein